MSADRTTSTITRSRTSSPRAPGEADRALAPSEPRHALRRPRMRARDRPAVPSPDTAATGVAARPRWYWELALVAVLYALYDTSRGLRHADVATADRSGARILRWEQVLHVDPEHALNHLLWEVPALAVTSSYYYATLHFIVTPAVLIWMYRRHPDTYRSARTALVVGTVIALVIYWLVPTTPPRLLVDGHFHDTLASVHQWGWWSSEGSAPRGLGQLTNQLAAMPSLHVGWALWSGWLLARHARRPSVRFLGGLYPVATVLVVMGTANHYLFDALAGAAVMAAGAGVARLATAARRPLLPSLGAAGTSRTPVRSDRSSWPPLPLPCASRVRAGAPPGAPAARPAAFRGSGRRHRANGGR